MVQNLRSVEQTLSSIFHGSLSVNEVDLCDLIDSFYQGTDDNYLGVACSQDAKGVVTHLAFATSSLNVLCVCLAMPSLKAKPNTQATIDSQRRKAQRALKRMFLHSEQKKFAFDMHKLALALFFDYGLTIVQAVDLQSSRPDDRRSVATMVSLLGGEAMVNKSAVIDVFQGESFAAGGIDNLAVRAWAARQAALRLTPTEIQSIASIDTSEIPNEVSLISHVTHASVLIQRLAGPHMAGQIR